MAQSDFSRRGKLSHRRIGQATNSVAPLSDYLVWPAALYEHLFEREPASSWYRLQIRQAVRFGTRSAGIAFAALLWPLLASLLSGSVTLTLIAYAIAIILDCVLFIVWLRHALLYSRGAARGETFTLERMWRRSHKESSREAVIPFAVRRAPADGV